MQHGYQQTTHTAARPLPRKFGSATGKAEDPTTKTEPGPGQYPGVLKRHGQERTPPAWSQPKAKR